MKLKIIAMMAALFFSANALAAIQITERQARNMDRYVIFLIWQNRMIVETGSKTRVG